MSGKKPQRVKRSGAKNRGRARLVPPAQRGYAERRRRYAEDAAHDERGRG